MLTERRCRRAKTAVRENKNVTQQPTTRITKCIFHALGAANSSLMRRFCVLRIFQTAELLYWALERRQNVQG
jgi:hypothetical protein